MSRNLRANPLQIAVIHDETTATVQSLFWDFFDELPAQVRVAGVIEEEGERSVLRSLIGGQTFPLFQDLGPMARGCAVNCESIAGACKAICDDLASACDLLIISKFGRLESEGGGLCPAFAAALDAQVPILTSAPPKFEPQWAAFAAPLYTTLPTDLVAIRRWWASVS